MADFGFFSEATARQLLADVRDLKSRIAGLAPDVSPQLIQPPIKVTNVSGEEIPPYAAMQCTGMEVIGGSSYIQVDQPVDSTGDAGGFLFNSSRAIATDGNGIGFAGPHVRAIGDGSTATASDRWAPASGSWEIEPTADGFLICVGDDNLLTDLVRCVYSYGAGASLVHAVSPGGGIAARSSLTMGSASCDIYNCSGAGVLSDSGNNDTIYNLTSSAVSGSKHIGAIRNTAGLLVVVVEDCG